MSAAKQERHGPARGAPEIRRLSVIAPMRNEAANIEALAEDLAGQDWDGELELIFADGLSDDGTPDLLRAAAGRLGLDVTILDNPARWAAPGLNRCLERATGDLIVRLDCHSRYPSDYLRLCVAAAEETGAWCVGGRFRPIGRTPTQRAVACALDSAFGGHNWWRYRGSTERADVRTVYCGAFRPDAFRYAGTYDEEMAICEVEDLNERLLRAGGRVVFDPRILLWYLPRDSYRGVLVQYYRYGLWKVAVMLKHRSVLSVPALVPFVFVLTLAGLGPVAPRSRRARTLLAAELGVYAAAAVGFGAASIRRRREDPRLLPRVAAVYPAFHLGHGLGMVHGWVRALRALHR